MALSLILGEAKLTATQMDTTAEVTLDKVDDGFAITKVHLTLRAKIPGADQAIFTEVTNKAKLGCPVSKVLKAEITLDAKIGRLTQTSEGSMAGADPSVQTRGRYCVGSLGNDREKKPALR